MIPFLFIRKTITVFSGHVVRVKSGQTDVAFVITIILHIGNFDFCAVRTLRSGDHHSGTFFSFKS